MSLDRFDLNLLVAFDVLMRELNVSRAASSLFIGQSAMSHTLNRLRQAMEDPILVKTRHGMKPTPRALELIGPVRKILQEIESAVTTKLEFDEKIARQRFVIAATDYSELIILPPLIKRIKNLAKGVEIHNRQPWQYLPEAELENGTINVVLGFDTSLDTPTRIQQHALFSDVLVSIVREGHPFIGDSITLEQYISMEHVLISPAGDNRGIVDQWLEKMNLTRNISLVVPHFLSAPLVIAQTDMILTLPYRIAEVFKQMSPLKLLHTPIDLPSFQMSMIWHPLYEKDPAQRWLRMQIKTAAQQIDAIPLSYQVMY